jgi:hypothetical protein
MDAELSTFHAPRAAAEIVDEVCRRVRECGHIVRSATCADKDDKRMAIRPNGRYWREAEIRIP